MTLQITKSHDNDGPGDGKFGQGSSLRDLLVSFNKCVTFLSNGTFQNPGFAINSNFDVKNANAISVTVGGVLKSLSANTNFDTGTAATITANLWGIFILTWDGTTATVTWSSTSAQAYATEALAIANLRASGTLLAPASGFAALGYVTVQAGAALWTAGTDALATGTGGTPANATNYYNDPTLNGAYGPWFVGNSNGTTITQ